MSFFTRNPSRDPSKIRETLQRLCRELSEALGADLKSIILYGSFARVDELDTVEDMVNMMFVLDHVDCQSLDKITDAVSRAEKEIQLATMTLTRDELRSSCDVFPIKFHDMQLHHRVLHGEDVLSDLEISDDHLRLRCEQQLKNLMLRLRATYLHRNQSGQQLLDALLDGNRNFMQDMHACLVVKSGIVPEDASDLAQAFGAAFELDASVVNDVLALRGNVTNHDTKELKQIYDRFMRLVHEAALAIDQAEVGA